MDRTPLGGGEDLGPLSGMGEIEESFTERTFELGLET
jgi:hypothetical protein